MRLLLVGNPAASGGRGRSRVERAERALAATGATVTTLLTERRGHAREALATPPGDVDRVVACGGDGLVSEVAAALAFGDLPMAIVPAGRGNDFAMGIDLPLDVEASALLAARGRVSRVDLGRCDDRVFCTVAACGLDAEVSRRGRTSRLSLPGAGTYVMEALRAIATFRPGRMRIELDDAVIDEDCLLVAVANTRTYGGGFLIAPAASATDGLLDACVVRATGRLRALRLFPAFYRGTHATLPEVRTLRVERVRIDATPGLDLEADGESLGRTPAVLTSARAALPIVVP